MNDIEIFIELLNNEKELKNTLEKMISEYTFKNRRIISDELIEDFDLLLFFLKAIKKTHYKE